MKEFIETIKCEHNIYYDISYHNKRLNNTIKNNFNIDANINLLDYLDDINFAKLYRCRILYDTKIQKIEYFKQEKREFKKFKLVENDTIMYQYKSANRDDINKLLLQKDNADDIIIIKNGLITDTSIANIAILQDKWYTPAMPLLKGTKRQKLLDNKIIYEKQLTIQDLKKSKKFAIMNALIDFYEINDLEIIF